MNNSPFGNRRKRPDSKNSNRHLYTKIYSSTTYKRKESEATQISTGEIIEKMWHTSHYY